MAHFTGANAFFVGSAYQQERPVALNIFKAAKKAGFSRFVEPCSGMLAGCVMAKQAGFEIAEASDVRVIPAIVGNYAADNEISDMRLSAGRETFSKAEEALFELKRIMLEKNTWNENGLAQYNDFVQKKEKHLEEIHEQLEKIRSSVPAQTTFKPQDMLEHIRSVKDDENAVVWLWPPTYAGGYERFYKSIDESILWECEPDYEMFDPKEGYRAIVDEFEDAKCLLVMGEESPKAIGHAVYARNSGKPGIKTYIVTNKPGLVESWVGRGISRPKPQDDEGGLFDLFDEDVSEDSTIEVVCLSGSQMRHYKKLLTKRFVPSKNVNGYAILIDGKLAGVFGYMDVGILLGGSKYAMQAFALSVPGHKLARLNTMVAMQREQLERHYDSLTMSQLKGVRMNVITDKKVSMNARGIMDLVDEKVDSSGRRMLVYQGEIGELSLEEVKREFIEDTKPKAPRKRRGNVRASRRDSSR